MSYEPVTLTDRFLEETSRNGRSSELDVIDATSYFAQQQHVVCEHGVCLVCDDVAFCHALVSNSSQHDTITNIANITEI